MLRVSRRNCSSRTCTSMTHIPEALDSVNRFTTHIRSF